MATTFRLWWQRHNHTAMGTWLRRAGVAALVLALAAVSGIAIGLARSGHPARPGAAKSPAASDPAALAAAAQSRQEAAAWVAAQVGRDVIVGCDPLMCTALQQHGFPAADLAPIGPSTDDPLGSGLVISTTAVRSQLGTRLTSVYAPQVIASFGTGPGLVQVLVTAPGGAAAYRAAEQADLRARITAGRQLLGNRDIRVAAAARQQLAAGLVDMRLLLTLAAMAHRYAIDIAGFGDAGPGAAPGTPLRAMTITVGGAPALRRLLAFLHAQRAPLLGQTTTGRAGRALLLQVQFHAPSPLGLMSQG
jgi:hypothetical protein